MPTMRRQSRLKSLLSRAPMSSLAGGTFLRATCLRATGLIASGLIASGLIATGIIAIHFTPQAAADDRLAIEVPAIEVIVKNHHFSPAEIHIPRGKAIALMVRNQDDTAEEFDSTALKVEKVIAAGHYATIQLRPLGPGRYTFKGEHHPDTANGIVVSE